MIRGFLVPKGTRNDRGSIRTKDCHSERSEETPANKTNIIKL